MKYINSILAVVSVGVLTACNESQDKLADWGNAVYYSDFLWNSYEPIIMEQTLELTFNDDAQRYFTGEAILELEYFDGETEKWQSAEEYMILYKNGVECEHNLLKLSVKDHEVVVGVEFRKNAAGRNYTLQLNPVDKGGLDEIEQIGLANGFMVEKIDIMNPLAKQTMWVIIILSVLFVIWIVLSRIVNPYLKFSRITFDYNNGAGEISYRVGSCYKIICTNKPKKISLLHRIFIGKIHVVVNEFWDQDLVIMSGSHNNIRLISSGEYIFPEESVRKEMFVITNVRQQIVNIETT